MKFWIWILGMVGVCSQGLFAEPPPHDGRFERAEYVSSLIKPGDIGAEIGVCMGVFAYNVLVPNQPSKLYLIDPWEYGLQADYEMDPTPENKDKGIWNTNMYAMFSPLFRM